jgi:phage gp29-like protein
MAISDWFKFKQKPLATSVSKATSGGSLYSEQAIDKMNVFFDNLMKFDTDEVLSNAGLSRHQLSVLLSDDEIDGKIETRSANLLQAKYTLSDGDSDVSMFIYEQLDEHLQSILTACLNAELYGYSVPEIVWDKKTKDRTGIIQPLSVVEKPMQWFEPKNDGRLLWFANNGSRGIEVDTTYKYLLIQHKPTYTEPKGKALLSRVYWLWYFKKNGWQFWSKFLERFGSPLLIGTTDQDPQALADALMSAHNQSVVAMGAGDSVTSISATSNGEAFKSYDDAINKRIAKYLLGQTLTSGTDTGGTYGQGLVHQDQQQRILDGDKKFAERYVQQFIDVICLLNGYESPTFAFTFEKGLQPERAERDSKLYSQGVRFTESYYVDAYDFDPEYIKIVEDIAAPVVQLSHKPKRALQFADGDNDEQFTHEQQELEQVADDALELSVQPFDVNAVLSAISNTTDADSLRESLFNLCGEGLAESEFTQLVNTAIQVADVHGFADESSEV